MKINTEDMISVTDANRDVSRLVSEASAGRTFIIMKQNTPAAALVGTDQLERLQRLDEQEHDLRLWSLALVRTITDTGARYNLEDVAAELGIDLNQE